MDTMKKTLALVLLLVLALCSLTACRGKTVTTAEPTTAPQAAETPAPSAAADCPVTLEDMYAANELSAVLRRYPDGVGMALELLNEDGSSAPVSSSWFTAQEAGLACDSTSSSTAGYTLYTSLRPQDNASFAAADDGSIKLLTLYTPEEFRAQVVKDWLAPPTNAEEAITDWEETDAGLVIHTQITPTDSAGFSSQASYTLDADTLQLRGYTITYYEGETQAMSSRYTPDYAGQAPENSGFAVNTLTQGAELCTVNVNFEIHDGDAVTNASGSYSVGKDTSVCLSTLYQLELYMDAEHTTPMESNYLDTLTENPTSIYAVVTK